MIALVTGANKGIGVCLMLLSHPFVCRIMLTCKVSISRTTSCPRAFLSLWLLEMNLEVSKLLRRSPLPCIGPYFRQLKGSHDSSLVFFEQLDIADSGSIKSAASRVQQRHGGIDVLVNNAGMAFKVIPAHFTYRTQLYASL
jgi:hypothetical protein